MGDLTYVSIDPGGSQVGARTIGLARWDESGRLLFMDQYSLQEMQDFLINLQEVKNGQLKAFIVEEYRVLPEKLAIHNRSKLETSQCIGQIKMSARILGVKVIEQPSTILGIAQQWSGTKMPKDHSKSHQISAYLHGYYYLYRKGLIKSRVLERLQKRDDSKLEG